MCGILILYTMYLKLREVHIRRVADGLLIKAVEYGLKDPGFQ